MMKSACQSLLLIVAAVLTSAAVADDRFPGEAAQREDSVVAVRVGDHGDKTRFVVELTAPLDFQLALLDRPHRLVVDFPPATWQLAEGAGGGGLIRGYRHGWFENGNLRIVLDLVGPVRVRDVFYLPATSTIPYRFVLDIEPTDTVQEAAVPPMVQPNLGPDSGPDPQAGSQFDTAAATLIPAGLQFPLPPHHPRSALPVIAIDPGHGGIDPGAEGAQGTEEKVITLLVARQIRANLEATGRYRVFLTRDADIFLRLRERVHLAREADADVFLSLHADHIEDPDVRGASVYTLSDTASDREAEMLAARENRADALAGVHLDPEDDVMAGILIDLAQRQTHNASNHLAEIMAGALSSVRPVVNNTHRRAGFAVLTAPDVPSVLIEMGYLSNTLDEAELTQEEHQAALASAIAGAIDTFYGVPRQVSGLQPR